MCFKLMWMRLKQLVCFKGLVERLRSTFELSRGAGAPSPPRGMTLSVRRMASTSTHAAGDPPHLRCHLNHFPQHWTRPIEKWRFCEYLHAWSCQNAGLVLGLEVSIAQPVASGPCMVTTPTFPSSEFGASICAGKHGDTRPCTTP
jgi:hypothetical protein